MNQESVTFASPTSFVESSFFVQLSDLKLNKFKLDTSYREIVGYYNYNALGKEQQPSLNLIDSSFSRLDEFCKQLPKKSYFISKGKLLNVNSIEEFKNINKKDFLQEAVVSILNCIKDKSFVNNTTLLSMFFLLSYADLKKYKFYYWVAFPQVQSNWTIISQSHSISYLMKDGVTFEDQFYILDDGLKKVATLFDYKNTDFLTILFIDTCSYKNTVSYILRNFLTALSIHNFQKVKIEVLKYNHRDFNYTMVLKNDDFDTDYWDNTAPRSFGWERTSQGKLGPKLANLSALIDPLQLASQATELNLKLMKWRLVPELDLQLIKKTKALILGSGTLGSYIARCLLAWGLEKITFVDNGKVSFSNPVRQPLFFYEDCINGGAPKAEIAATNLRKIYPLVEAKGYSLEIPMIGHPVKYEEKEKKAYEQLLALIEDHDVIFIALDSREARWLPTLIGNARHKIVINSALGFESYLVMRHGNINPSIPLKEQLTGRLGCYFCNDIVAPKDSLTDRTLDQMCTVTRPGVALMASSLATELLVSIQQSPDKQYSKHIVDEKSNILGSLPHQLRGFLHNFELLKLSSKNFKFCTACSVAVVSEFNNKGWDFVKTALNDETYLEKLTGLQEFIKEAEQAASVLDDFEDSDFEDEIN